MSYDTALKDFSINVGIKINDDDSIIKAEELIKRIKQVFNDKLSIDGKQLFNGADTEEELAKLNSLLSQTKHGITSTFADVGSECLSKFTINLENIHGTITTMLVDFEKMNKEIGEMNLGAGEKSNVNTASLITTSISDKQNPRYVLQEIIEQYNTIKSLTASLSKYDNGTKTWTYYNEQLNIAKQGLKNILKANEDLVSQDKFQITLNKNKLDLKNQISKIKANKDDSSEIDNQNDLKQSLNSRIKLQEQINKAIKDGDNNLLKFYEDEISEEEKNSVFYEGKIKNKEKILLLEDEYSKKIKAINADEKDNENSNVEKQNLSLYEDSINTLQKIQKIKLQMVSADEKSRILLSEQLKLLEESYTANRKQNGLGSLTIGQKDDLTTKSTGNDSVVNKYREIYNLEKEIIDLNKQETNAQSDLKQSLNTQVDLQKQINTANSNGDTNKAKALSDILEKQKNVSNQLYEQITDEKEKNKLLDIYDEKMSVVNASEKDKQKKQDTGEDNKTIQQTIKLYQQLTEERVKLNKLQSQGAKDVVIKQNQEALSELESSYKKISSTILKDNSVVSDNAKVVKNVTDEDRKLVEAQNGVTKGVNDSTVHVNGFNSTLTSMIKNVFQYRIASTAFQQVDQAILASVQKVKALDDSMTQIRLVTGGTSADAQKMIGTYADLAVQLHTTTQAVADGYLSY